MDPRRLTRFWRFDSRDTDAASVVVSNVLSPVRFTTLGINGHFHYSIEILQIGDIYVWHSMSSTGFRLNRQVVRNFIFELHFLEAGHCSTVTNNLAIQTNPGDVLLLTDFSKHDLVCQPDTSQLCIAIPSAHYSILMASEFGDPFADLSSMQPVANSGNTNIQSLKQIVDLVLSLGRSVPVEEKSPTAALLLCKCILTLFAERWPRSTVHPTNYSARPFYVKRAMDWIHSHAAERITLEQLATVSGVSGRTLQLGFQNFCGLSPMAFLLKVRLEKAYWDLVTELPPVTVNEIARRWRFSNPGKFAADIRATYGKNPQVIRQRPNGV